MNVGFEEVLSGTGRIVDFVFTDMMVSRHPDIVAKLITTRDWHRFASLGCDDMVRIRLSQVLPPVEDTY